MKMHVIPTTLNIWTTSNEGPNKIWKRKGIRKIKSNRLQKRSRPGSVYREVSSKDEWHYCCWIGLLPFGSHMFKMGTKLAKSIKKTRNYIAIWEDMEDLRNGSHPMIPSFVSSLRYNGAWETYIWWAMLFLWEMVIEIPSWTRSIEVFGSSW